MSDVTRFEMDMDGSMEPAEYGRWVRHEDYAALKAERDALRAAIRTHNADAKVACEARAGWCDAWTDRDLRCPDCPRHYEIEEPTP